MWYHRPLIPHASVVCSKMYTAGVPKSHIPVNHRRAGPLGRARDYSNRRAADLINGINNVIVFCRNMYTAGVRKSHIPVNQRRDGPLGSTRDYFKFLVVRHPLDRLASAYSDKVYTCSTSHIAERVKVRKSMVKLRISNFEGHRSSVH